MMSEVDVFVSNYTLVDPEIYQLWVDGHSSSDAVNILQQRGICMQTNAPLDLVASDVLDHYRTYALLEKLLHTPTKLATEQLAFQIEPQTSQMLIEMYYEFDDIVVRELLGKKLTSKSRKDMDEVSEKTGVTLKSCRRQYDNVKRVFKVVEDLPGSLVTNIRQHFLLSEDLAKYIEINFIFNNIIFNRILYVYNFIYIYIYLKMYRRYAAVVFIACLRFEMSKRKLQFLTFPDLYHCANSMMVAWTYRCVGSEYFDTDLDREFLVELAECRVLLENDKHHKHLVCIKLKPMLLERSYQEVDTNFRSYSRAILGIGCNLHRSRELRFFFLELVERCIEPWKQVNWSHTDLRNFLSVYTQCALDMDVLREIEIRDAFERYMTVVTCCLLRMYHT
ncbi:acidic fibroblast growth factor intracellular-binding protein isoform X2 [Vespula pensylvanica]|uniref:acidic fibroblast growth factor intracellular-binding protein isoform X2 n=1 Tax=Vespula pensylvanica TaxID=30213 RepID=UPI001CB9E9BA|nr:acidic fibroblast growth factor intracellular-binding protein isoform X2 [Vespula pensylvanica]